MINRINKIFKFLILTITFLTIFFVFYNGINALFYVFFKIILTAKIAGGNSSIINLFNFLDGLSCLLLSIFAFYHIFIKKNLVLD
jgi:hypothetical protein